MPNVREIDRDDDIYVGIGFPLDHSPEGFFYKTKTIREQVKSNIRNLLLTSKGERVFQPNFGSNLKSLLFEQITPSSLNELDNDVRQSISTWLPYVNINDLVIVQNETNENQVMITLEFSTTLEPNTLDTISFNFDVGV